MAPDDPEQITRLLVQWAGGDRSALDLVTAAVYGEMRKIADGYLRRERTAHTLQPTALVNETWERFGRLDVLVNNGGGQFPQAAVDFSQKGWLAVIDTNLNGSWYMMQAAARQWQKRNTGGSIVSIVANVTRGMPQVAHTCAARAGVIALSKTLSTEWAPLKIR